MLAGQPRRTLIHASEEVPNLQHYVAPRQVSMQSLATNGRPCRLSGDVVEDEFETVTLARSASDVYSRRAPASVQAAHLSYVALHEGDVLRELAQQHDALQQRRELVHALLHLLPQPAQAATHQSFGAHINDRESGISRRGQPHAHNDVTASQHPNKNRR